MNNNKQWKTARSCKNRHPFRDLCKIKRAFEDAKDNGNKYITNEYQKELNENILWENKRRVIIGKTTITIDDIVYDEIKKIKIEDIQFKLF